MPRLDGEKKSPLPLILGIAAVAALGVLGYYLLSNRETNAGNEAGTITTNTSNNAGRDAAANNATSDNATGDNSATDNGTSGAASDNATNGAASDNATNGAASDNSASGSRGATPSPTASATRGGTSGTSGTSGKPGAMGGGKATPQPIAKRSKTIVNNKTGTTTIYSKEIHGNGTITHSKTVTPAPVPTRP